MAFVSIIVPVYKVELFIQRCVDSILNQSYRDFELILVDDGSPDNCGRICDEYAEKDSRIHVIHQPNGGLSAARNAGIDWVFANSDSQWITFVDSDDWIHCDYLRILIRIILENKSQIAMCSFAEVKTSNYIDADVSVQAQCLESEEVYTRYYYQCMTACCKIYDKNLWCDLRFPKEKLYEDSFVTHIMIFSANNVSVTEGMLYYYFCNPNSITRTKWSPKRWDEIEGHSVRLYFLKKKGMLNGYVREVEEFKDVLVRNIDQLSEDVQNFPQYKVHLKRMRKKLREVLHIARNHDLYPFTDEYWGIYTKAYPNRLTRIALWCYLKIMRFAWIRMS